MLHWVFLFAASAFEIGWPIGLKIADEPGRKIMGFGLAVFCMLSSSGLLWLSLKGIPIGTAYAVWTGIGAAGTFLIGVAAYGDPSSVVRYIGVALIISGVIALKVG